jgi:hypothetical protein
MLEVVQRGGGGRHRVRRRVTRVWETVRHGDEKNGKRAGVAVLVVVVGNEPAGPKMSVLGQKWVRRAFFS